MKIKNILNRHRLAYLEDFDRLDIQQPIITKPKDLDQYRKEINDELRQLTIEARKFREEKYLYQRIMQYKRNTNTLNAPRPAYI